MIMFQFEKKMKHNVVKLSPFPISSTNKILFNLASEGNSIRVKPPILSCTAATELLRKR